MTLILSIAITKSSEFGVGHKFAHKLADKNPYTLDIKGREIIENLRYWSKSPQSRRDVRRG